MTLYSWITKRNITWIKRKNTQMTTSKNIEGLFTKAKSIDFRLKSIKDIKNDESSTSAENVTDVPLSRKLTLGCLISIFTFQSSVITSIVTLFDCQSIQSNLYIREYLLENCDSSRYMDFYHYLALPVFIVFAIGLPLGVFIYMFANRKEIYSKEVMNRIGFLINGYKTNYYYWEFVFFFKKILVIYLIQYLDCDILQKSLALLVVFMVSLLIQTECNPFLTKNLNALEFNESISLLFILAAATLSYLSTNDTIKTICSLAILFFNCQFIFFSLKEIVIYKIVNAKLFKKKYLAWLTPLFRFIYSSNFIIFYNFLFIFFFRKNHTKRNR